MKEADKKINKKQSKRKYSAPANVFDEPLTVQCSVCSPAPPFKTNPIACAEGHYSS